MDILSPLFAAVMALLEFSCQEEISYIDDVEAPIQDAYAFFGNMRQRQQGTGRHIRHPDGVHGLGIEGQKSWMLVRNSPARHGADLHQHLIPKYFIF